MAIHVHAVSVSMVGASGGAAAFGPARASEAITVGSAGSVALQDGEIFVVTSGESAAAYIAIGSVPDASVEAATGRTSARMAVASGMTLPVTGKVGDTIDTAAV